MLAPMLHPSLSVIDGFEGMEGNGPINGTPVDHRVCVVSTDYLAADTVGATLMGIDPADIGYLTYLASAKVGESDLGKMEILGEPVAKLAKKYQLGSSIEPAPVEECGEGDGHFIGLPGAARAGAQKAISCRQAALQWKRRGAKSLRSLRQVSHSWAVPGDSK